MRRPTVHRLRRALVAALVLFVVAVVVASFISIPYYAITPGQAIDVADMVSLPNGLDHAHPGRVLMTDVNLISLRAIDYLYYRWNGTDQVVPASELTGGATAAQYAAQGAIDMANARQAATVVALSTLGYRVRARPAGVIVYQPLARSPAAGRLKIGEVISSVDGVATPTPVALEQVLAKQAPGTRVRLDVHVLGSTSTRVVRLRLGRITSTSCAVVPARATASAARPCVGILIEPAYRTTGMPFAVKIDSEGIIGPSAGLAFTLGLIDALNRGDLTGGHRVAATGTMSVNGQVGPVGGVAQKTVAVERAGAQVFFVPPQEYATARAHATGRMHVEAVATLHQAIVDLERLGGRLVAPSSTSSRS